MDSKSTLQYLLSVFIVLANVEGNFGRNIIHYPALHDLDCYYRSWSWNNIYCHGESKLDEQISKLKELYPSTTINVEFSNHHLYNFEMTSESFKGLKIRSLEFTGSSIKSFTETVGGPAFVGLEDSMQELTLSYVKIEDAPGVKSLFSLSHLRTLKELKISHTNIQTFGNGYLSGSSLGNSLKDVDLADNKITEIGDAAFASLVSLEFIHLGRNKINIVERSMFPNPAPHLKEINLDNNGIETLKPDMFENMPSLTVVDLMQTRLQVLDEPTFKPIWSQLEILRFDDVSCEEEDIRWMVKIHHPTYLHVHCKGENTELQQKIERMRKELQ